MQENKEALKDYFKNSRFLNTLTRTERGDCECDYKPLFTEGLKNEKTLNISLLGHDDFANTSFGRCGRVVSAVYCYRPDGGGCYMKQ